MLSEASVATISHSWQKSRFVVDERQQLHNKKCFVNALNSLPRTVLRVGIDDQTVTEHLGTNASHFDYVGIVLQAHAPLECYIRACPEAI